MKELLQQIVNLLAEILFQQKLQLVPIQSLSISERWLDQRTAMYMTMRTERQLFRYVKDGRLISKKIGQANVYLESSILLLVAKKEMP
jgi:esterase/lipase superfamily enzyme